jgi:hypothetical protein
MDFYVKDGVILRTAEIDEKVKKTKKGGGVAAILGLAKDLMDFQAKVNDCCEAQDMTEIKDKIESHAESLAKMYEDLLDIAKAGVKSIRESNPNAETVNGEAIEMDAPPAPATQEERPKQPLLQTPSIPKLSGMGI